MKENTGRCILFIIDALFGVIFALIGLKAAVGLDSAMTKTIEEYIDAFAKLRCKGIDSVRMNTSDYHNLRRVAWPCLIPDFHKEPQSLMFNGVCITLDDQAPKILH